MTGACSQQHAESSAVLCSPRLQSEKCRPGVRSFEGSAYLDAANAHLVSHYGPGPNRRKLEENYKVIMVTIITVINT